MANRTDPLISQVSGSDPQNLMEYLTRQRIYESRYWKETCFGLSVEHVLEESTITTTAKTGTGSYARGAVAVGHLNFLALALKLLQLHPESELVMETFCGQDKFKYTRALGALYVRLTGRPADIYTCLEGLYTDVRRLRRYNSAATAGAASSEAWTNDYHMDEYIHELLTESHVSGIALPRLPLRSALQEAGYLQEGPRLTGLQTALEQYGADPLAYLKHKALIEKSVPALELWNSKYAALFLLENNNNNNNNSEIEATQSAAQKEPSKKKAKKMAGERLLFKQQPLLPSAISTTTNTTTPTAIAAAISKKGSDQDYWNEQRAKLGLSSLRK